MDSMDKKVYLVTSPLLTMQKETRIRLKPDIEMALRYYIAEQSAIASTSPGLTIDRYTVVNDVMSAFLAEKGHYPPRSE